MVSVNTVVLGGHLGADPEDRRTASGKAVSQFRLAVSRWEKASEEEVTDWYTIVAFERTAETCIKHLRKGSGVVVEGRLQVRQWDGADGKKQTKHEVVATRVCFVGGKSARLEGEAPMQETTPPRAREPKAFTADSVPF